jgi:UDPglucose--hexose-1-phosphate uridylyltransferase
MVGYEMMGESQRDITAEKSAQMLREVSDIHYKSK